MMISTLIDRVNNTLSCSPFCHPLVDEFQTGFPVRICQQRCLIAGVSGRMVSFSQESEVRFGRICCLGKESRNGLKSRFLLLKNLRESGVTMLTLGQYLQPSRLHWPVDRYLTPDVFESMRQNNTSAFNYRTVPFSDRLSNHAFGFAMDINPVQNPYYTGQQIFPENAVYYPSIPGTLYDEHPVVLLFKVLGWRWGGDWYERDYQHYDKQLEKIELEDVQNHYLWPPWR